MAPMRLADYPPDWRAISKRIREERADGRCECAGECGRTHAPTPHRSSWLAQPERCDELNGEPALHFNGRVVLTVAHLDHDPASRDEARLRAFCQACHLRYDGAHHAATRAAARRLPTSERPPRPAPTTTGRQTNDDDADA